MKKKIKPKKRVIKKQKVFSQVDRSLPSQLLVNSWEKLLLRRRLLTPLQWDLSGTKKPSESKPTLFNTISGSNRLEGNEERPLSPEECSILFGNPALRNDGVPPAHYAHGKLEPWHVVRDWQLDYFTGSAMKYICRHKHKGNPVQDIQKAIDYLVEYKQTPEKK